MDIYLCCVPCGSLEYPGTELMDILIQKAGNPSLKESCGVTDMFMSYQLCCWFMDTWRTAACRQHEYLMNIVKIHAEGAWNLLQELMHDIVLHMAGCGSTKKAGVPAL